MIREENTAVIACMDKNYENNLVNDFLHTLRNDAKYKGTIVILDYGMSEDKKQTAQKKYDCILHQCKRDYKLLFSVRNRDVEHGISLLPSNVTHIMSIDGGDVWFQDEILSVFKICKNRIGYVESNCYIDNHEWTLKVLSVLDEESEKKLLKNFKGQKLKNAGMVCGPRELIKQLSNSVYDMTKQTRLDFFGLDQLYFNYVINNMDSDKTVSLPQKYNYILIENKSSFVFHNKKIYDSDKKLINIVHNAGGMNRVLKKQEDNKDKEWIYQKILPI